jgi:DNA replication protein DnaC
MYPRDAGQCVPECPVCHGLGLVKDPDRFGKLIDCPNKITPFKWNEETGITEKEYQFYSGMHFIPTKNSIMIQDALKTIENTNGWLYLYGEPGIGKSTSIIRWFIEKIKENKTGRYHTHSSLTDLLRTSYDEKNGQDVYSSRIEEIKKYPVFVIDELDRDRDTTFSRQVLHEIFDYRYRSALTMKTITIYISNYEPEKILDKYQTSRVRDGRFLVIELKPVSIRPAMTWDK